MNKYYAHINLLDNSIGKGQCPCSGDNIVCLEITKDVYDNIEHYIYENGELILDPDYDSKVAELEKIAMIEEIKAQLDALDLKSIRAIRAKDEEYIDKYEAEAQELRRKISELS